MKAVDDIRHRMMILKKQMRVAGRRILEDLKKKELIPIKILFFMQATTIAVLYPYLTVHMRGLGLNVEETAIMSALVPVLGVIMPPLAGMVADKIGNFKILLSVLSLLGGLVALLLLLVPQAREVVRLPDTVVFGLGCDGHVTVLPFDGHPCFNRSTSNLTMEVCGVVCKGNHTSGDADYDAIVTKKNYTIRIGSTTTTHVLLEDESAKSEVKNRQLRYRYHPRSIRLAPDGGYFFPSAVKPGVGCSETHDLSKWYLFTLGDQICAVGDEGWSIVDRLQNQSLQKTTCTKGSDDITVETEVGSETFVLSQCEPLCLLSDSRKTACRNDKEEVEYNPSLTFWVYLVARVIVAITGGTAYAMFEVAVISILREQKADYGLQRIYSSIGTMIASPLSGVLIDYVSAGLDSTDYRPAFYLYAGLKAACALIVLLINLKFKKSAKSVISDFFQLLKNVEVICLLGTCFFSGCAWGYLESFLFWFLEDLGGNRFLMGLTVTIGGLAGLPLLVISGPIINKIGHANVIVMGFIFYTFRLLGYSLIENPYHCLYFEAMESVTMALATTASITYAAKLSTTTTDGSIQGLVGGLYFGVGKGAGTLIGGYLMNAYGTRETFMIMAGATLVTGIVYFLINQFYIRNLPNWSGRDSQKKEDESKPEKETPEPKKQDHDNEGYVPTEPEAEKDRDEDNNVTALSKRN